MGSDGAVCGLFEVWSAVYTDNNPLTYVLTTAKLNAVGMRWVNDLADYQFTIKYRPGKENVDADYLSRRPLSVEEMKSECTEQYEPREIRAVISSVLSHKPALVNSVLAKLSVIEPVCTDKLVVPLKELVEMQQKDEVVGPVYQFVSLGSRPSRKEWAQLSSSSKSLLKSFNKLSINDKGVLLRTTVQFRQIVLPECYRQLVYRELHEEMGHLGVEKVYELAQQRFHWPGMARDIQNHIQNRCRCLVDKKPNVQDRAPLMPMVAQYPFEMVAIDLLHLDKCKGGFEYAMVVTDHFTRFAQVYALKNKSTRGAADKLFNHYIMQFGWPTKIHSDKGGEFTSKLFEELQKLTGIIPSKTTPYHPQGNGKAERFNRTLCNMLKTLSDRGKKDWKSYLPKLSFAYNATINKTTKFSPFKLMFGREGRLPVDFMFEGTDREKLKDRSYEDFVQKWGESMEEACQVARANMGKVAEWNKKNYDRKAGAQEISIGDRVLMQNCREKGGTGKLRSYWEESIFEVVEKRADAPVYRIRNIHKEKDERVVHRNLLMQCNQLPEDVFGKPAAKKENREKKNVAVKKKEVVVESEWSESEEDLDGVFVVLPADAVPEEVINTDMGLGSRDEDRREVLEVENAVQGEADEAHDPAQTGNTDNVLEPSLPSDDEAEQSDHDDVHLESSLPSEGEAEQSPPQSQPAIENTTPEPSLILSPPASSGSKVPRALRNLQSFNNPGQRDIPQWRAATRAVGPLARESPTKPNH